MAVNKTEFDKINGQYNALNGIKTNQMKEQVESTRQSLLGLLQENAIDVSDTKSLEKLSQNIEGIQNKIQLEPESGKKLQSQKDAIDRVIKLLNKVKLKPELSSIQANNFSKFLLLGKLMEIDNSENNPDETSLKPSLSLSSSSSDYQITATKPVSEKYTISDKSGHNVGVLHITPDDIIFDIAEDYNLTQKIELNIQLSYHPVSLPIESLLSEENPPFFGHITHTKKLIIGSDKEPTPKNSTDITNTIPPREDNLRINGSLEAKERFSAEKEKLLKDLLTLEQRREEAKDDMTIIDIKQDFQQLFDTLPQGILESLDDEADRNSERNIAIKYKWNELQKKLQNRKPANPEISKKNLTTPERPQTTYDIKQRTQAQLKKLFEIDANFMDKERLVDQEIRNKVRNQAEKNYMNAGGIKKFGMYLGNRRTQSSKRKKELNHRKNTNQFIESDTTLQKRIEGNIGTHATTEHMGLDKNTINRVSLGDDKRINEIAHEYLLDKSKREKTITELNTLFASDTKFNKGGMTGTDIMNQLDSINENDYKAKLLDSKLDTLAQENLRIRVNLWGVDKTGGTELESSEYKSNAVNTGRHKFARGINLLGFNGAGRLAKPLFAVGLSSAGFGGLGLAVGITGLGAVLQRAKSQDDAMKEIAKTHEDYLAMGGAELQNTIKRLEQEIEQKTGAFARLGSKIGIGQKARAIKQLSIAQALNGLNATGVMISDEKAITDLKTAHAQNLAPILDTLARIEAGQEFDTHFFTSTTRDTITSQRYKIMQELKEAVGRIPGIKKSTWEETWAELRKNNAYIAQRNSLGQAYTQVEKDITSARGKIARKDFGSYLAVAAGGMAVTGAGSSLYNSYMGGHNVDTGNLTKTTTRLEGVADISQYELGKYDEGHAKHIKNALSQVNDGQTISITGESGVDGVSAFHNFAEVDAKVIDVQTMIKNSSLNPATKTALLDSLDTGQVDFIRNYAADHGADFGNRNLAVGRRAEGIEEITKHLTDNKMNNLIIEKVTFDPNAFVNVDVQKSGGSADALHRMFGARIDLITTVDTRSTDYVGGDYKPWIVPIPYFANTYAASNSKTEDLPNRNPDKTPNKGGYVYDPSKDIVQKKVPLPIDQRSSTLPLQAEVDTIKTSQDNGLGKKEPITTSTEPINNNNNGKDINTEQKPNKTESDLERAERRLRETQNDLKNSNIIGDIKWRNESIYKLAEVKNKYSTTDEIINVCCELAYKLGKPSLGKKPTLQEWIDSLHTDITTLNDLQKLTPAHQQEQQETIEITKKLISYANNLKQAKEATEDSFLKKEYAQRSTSSSLNEKYLQNYKEASLLFQKTFKNEFPDSPEKFKEQLSLLNKTILLGSQGTNSYSRSYELNKAGLIRDYNMKGSSSSGQKDYMERIAKVMGITNYDNRPDQKYTPKDEVNKNLDEAYLIIKEIKGAIDSKNESLSLEKMSDYYRIMSKTRPFRNVNNSISMLQINVMLTELGKKPVPHGYIDYLANRASKEEFRTIFLSHTNNTLKTPKELGMLNP